MIFQSKNQFWTRIRRLPSCSAGAVAVVTAIVLPALLGFTGLGVEIGHWYFTQRHMQGAADAAAISAAAEYIQNVNGTSYQQVGVNYASLNGFTISTSNVCLVAAGGDNCDTVRSLDSRTITCPASTTSNGITTAWACVVVEITQNTATWLTTKASLMPSGLGKVQSIPTPTLLARSIVAIKVVTSPATTTAGTDCILALANSTSAIQVSGSKADLKANCGIAVDGGRDQMVSGTPVGGISFNGSGAKINVAALDIAGPQSSSVCTNNPATTDKAHCQTFGGSPLTAVRTNQATLDPYTAALNFTNPLGVNAVARVAQGSGYTNGTRTFTLACVAPNCTAAAKFTVTVSGGKVTSTTGTVIDPGAYTVFPTGAVSGTPDTGGGSGATFNLTQGCFNWPATPIAGRTYCSITLSGNFPPGNYYTVGNITGTGNTGATAVASGTTPPGVTFFQSGGGYISILGNANYNLCAPGTVASGHQCDSTSTACNNAAGSCILFVQKATLPGSATTVNDFSGTQSSVFSGLIYLPDETFRSGGNGTVGGCFGVVAQYVLVQGTPTFSQGCLPGNGIGGTNVPGTTTASSPSLYQ